MEEARQHPFVDQPWFARVMDASALVSLVLAPLALVSFFFGDVFFYLVAAFCAVAFVRLVLLLTWGWHKGEFRQAGARICGRRTSPGGYWAIMLFGVFAAGMALFGVYMSISVL